MCHLPAYFTRRSAKKDLKIAQRSYRVQWFCGVMVSTLDSESNDPSSSLGRTSSTLYFISLTKGCFPLQSYRTKTYRISLLSEYYNGTNDFETQKKMLWYVTVRLKWKTVLTISSVRVFSITLYFMWWSLLAFCIQGGSQVRCQPVGSSIHVLNVQIHFVGHDLSTKPHDG